MSDQQKNTAHENAIGWIILGGVCLALFFLFWYFFEYQMKDLIRWIRVGEAQVIALFVDENYTVTIGGDKIPFEASIRDMKTIDTVNIDVGLMGLMTRIALEPYKIPMVIVYALMALWALMLAPVRNTGAK